MSDHNILIDAPHAIAELQKGIPELMIDEFFRRLSRTGLDGTYYRSFIVDWLYIERPMLDRFKGAEFSVQFEGPPIEIEGETYPLGGFVERYHEIVWARISPASAYQLRKKLRQAVDQTVHDWMAVQRLSFVPAHPEKPFADRIAADAEAERQIRAYAGSAGDIGKCR